MSRINIPPHPGLKWCSHCQDFQSIDQFAVHPSRPGGRDYYCRPHRAAMRKAKPYAQVGRQAHLKCAYGLSQATYDTLLAAQAGVCAICKQPETATYRKKIKALAVDHDHETGTVRGLLCAHCNRAIGLLGDNPATLEYAIAYLTTPR